MARQTDQKRDALNKALKANMAKRKAQAKALAAQDEGAEEAIKDKE